MLNNTEVKERNRTICRHAYCSTSRQCSLAHNLVPMYARSCRLGAHAQHLTCERAYSGCEIAWHTSRYVRHSYLYHMNFPTKACGTTRWHQRIQTCAECNVARNMHVCRLYYYASSLRCCWALCGVVNWCLLAIMQSSLPLWSFEQLHSGSITLCACLDALRSSCCTTCLGESKLMGYKYVNVWIALNFGKQLVVSRFCYI